jgi:hypothetical protein
MGAEGRKIGEMAKLFEVDGLGIPVHLHGCLRFQLNGYLVFDPPMKD